ncbi:MAG: hypothetical protein ACYDCB_08765, partial [Candidatus Dormibacteria bacterium]
EHPLGSGGLPGQMLDVDADDGAGHHRGVSRLAPAAVESQAQSGATKGLPTAPAPLGPAAASEA